MTRQCDKKTYTNLNYKEYKAESKLITFMKIFVVAEETFILTKRNLN
jgi:hypothetical protein